jgi:hypothetical protein
MNEEKRFNRQREKWLKPKFCPKCGMYWNSLFPVCPIHWVDWENKEANENVVQIPA